MKDLELAKRRLGEGGLTLCIVKDEHVLFETASHGISGFLRAVLELGECLVGASAADIIVGKAIGLLCLYARVDGVYGLVMSEEARKLFEENKVHAEWGELVGNILGDGKLSTCPFEGLAAAITDPEEAYKKLKGLQDSLKRRR
jgi:hypothetical protein